MPSAFKLAGYPEREGTADQGAHLRDNSAGQGWQMQLNPLLTAENRMVASLNRMLRTLGLAPSREESRPAGTAPNPDEIDPLRSGALRANLRSPKYQRRGSNASNGEWIAYDKKAQRGKRRPVSGESRRGGEHGQGDAGHRQFITAFRFQTAAQRHLRRHKMKNFGMDHATT